MSKSKTPKPLVPLLVPSVPGEGGAPVEVHPGAPPGPVSREFTLQDARDMLRYSQRPVPEINEVLEKVRLVSWENRPALYIEDRTLAPYVRNFVRFEGECGLARCPKCGKWFVQKRPNQVYDSIRHREAHRVTRWRAGWAQKNWAAKNGAAKKPPAAGQKKWLVDTFFAVPRYITCVRVLGLENPQHLPCCSLTFPEFLRGE